MNGYLQSILTKYKAHDITGYLIYTIPNLKTQLTTWASGCFIEIIEAGSRAKGTAISIASDVDYVVSLTSNCHENSRGLKAIYDSLWTRLSNLYPSARKQNVSVRVKASDLSIDITPARKQPGFTDDHWIWVSKTGTRQQTNVKKHIRDISSSGRLDEIKLLKIWRELHRLDFPSIYMEYLLVQDVLSGRAKGSAYVDTNLIHIFNELAKDQGNPLFSRVIDPANSTNILSDLLTVTEKNKIIIEVKKAKAATKWSDVVW